MIKQYLHCFENIASVPFQDHVTVIEFDASGGEYKNNEHDITLSIPEGAIPHGEIVHIEVAIALYGPFSSVMENDQYHRFFGYALKEM